MKLYSTTLFLVCSILFFKATAQNDSMALVKGGVYLPLYGASGQTVKVDPFMMDIYPVTNEEYLKFVKENPKWKKSNVISLLDRKSTRLNSSHVRISYA